MIIISYQINLKLFSKMGIENYVYLQKYSEINKIETTVYN